MFKFVPPLFATLLIGFAFPTLASDTNDDAICQAAGIGAGNVSSYQTTVFNENPRETMRVLASAKASLAKQPEHLRNKIDLAIVNAASPKSWTSVRAAMNEFGKLCPCGGQSPCGTPITNPVKVN
jgi:hypothetical protein